MVKNSIINKITPCCGLPFSVAYWWVSNLTLTTEEEREYILSKISHGGTISIDAWKTLINAGTLDPDASLSKDDFLEWFDYGRQPTCARLKIIINSFEIGAWTPETELPLNIALIDMIVNGENLSGNVYTKQQVNALITGSFGGKLMVADVPAPAGRVWYFAGESGTYVNAGNQTVDVSGKMVVLIHDAGEWSQIEIAAVEGRGITSVTLSGSVAEIDTYVITYSDGTNSSFQVKNGVDGKTTEPWEPKAYLTGSTVYYQSAIWENEVPATATDIPSADSSVWKFIFSGNQVVEGTNLVEVADGAGSRLASWNKDGKFKTEYEEDSIPYEALPVELGTYFQGSAVTENEEWREVLTDDAGHIIRGVRRDGTLYVARLEADEYAGNTPEEAEEAEPITDATFLTFDFPDSVVDVDVYGTLPFDISDARAPTNVVLTFRKGGQFLFKCKGIMAIQGQGSVGYAKKGYEVDFLNSKDETLMVKWGKMHAVDAINFKGFHSDPTMTRDVSASRLWYKIRTSRPFPSSFIADFTANIATTNAKYLYQDDALFYAEGFPMRMTSNGNPFGLYVWRMKKKRENYRMDNGNLNNIFLDSANSSLVLDFTQFKPEQWDLKSPKVSGYQEAGPINNATVMASINRFFNWVGEAINKTDAEFRNEAPNYFNLDSLFDYILSCEAVCAVDSSGNNTELMTWNGLNWSFCIYDQDNSAGFFAGFMGTTTKALRGDFWYKIKEAFKPEIEARYAELRDNGVLSLNSFYDIYSQIPRTIPTEYYIENLSIWGWVGQAEGTTSLRHIMGWFTGRLEFLDTEFNYN